MHKTSPAFPTKTLAAVWLVAMLAISASAQTERIVYSFTGLADGGLPGWAGGLVIDSKGNLYGATEEGGVSAYCQLGCGTVFELSPGSNGTWTEQVLYNFGSTLADGAYPVGGLVFDGKGNLYGTTSSGTQQATYGGTVFELSPGSNGTWAETILYAFGGGSEGADPFWGVALDSSGNMYGTTQDTGSSSFGNVYELVPASSGTWAENVLHSFTGGNDGATPWTTVTLDGAGSVYGVTGGGGAHDYGVVFKLTPGSNGIWTEKVLFAFSGGGPGSAPYGGLVLDGAGNLYGVSNYSVFELTPGSNGAWTQKLLYSFSGGSDGAYPLAPLIFDKSGNLYGTTNTGGHHLGTVFELSLGSNGVWTEKVLHRFSPSGGDGVNPNAARLVLDIKGNLYGTTQLGGASNRGVVFEVTP